MTKTHKSTRESGFFYVWRAWNLMKIPWFIAENAVQNDSYMILDRVSQLQTGYV